MWRTDRPLASVFLLYSFWLPQIVYSAVTGTKPSMQIPYVLGITLTRLFVPLYILGCPSSIFIQIYHFLDSSPSSSPSLPMSSLPVHLSAEHEACLVLVTWLTLQVLLVVGQQQLGARCFVPAALLPPRYNYRRPIPRQVLHSQAQTGPAISSTTAGTLGNYFALRNSNNNYNFYRNDGSSTDDMELRVLLNPAEQIDEGFRQLECIICNGPIDGDSRSHMVNIFDRY